MKPEALTPAQERELDDIVARLRAASFSTTPADRDAAEAAASRLYQASGFATPRFVWLDSPAAARTTAYVARYHKGPILPESRLHETVRLTGLDLGDDLHRPIFDATRARTGSRVEEILSKRLASHGVISGSHLANDVWNRLGGGPLRDLTRLLEHWLVKALDAGVREATGEGACILAAWVDGGSRPDIVSPSPIMDGFGGQFELPWPEYARFMGSIVGGLPPAVATNVEAHATLNASCGPWFPHRNICLLTERPSRISLDDRGLAHHDSLAAVEFRDGSGAWAIEGVLVDEAVVRTPASITIDAIRSEENEEVRRILIGRYGWERFLTDTHAEVVDMDADADGILRALMDAGGHRVLVCACTSTGRTFTMEVAPGCRTCEGAAAWLAGDDGIRIIAQS